MAILMTTEYQVISRIYLDLDAQIITYGKYVSQSRDNNSTTYKIKDTYYSPNYNISFDGAWNYLGDTGSDRHSEKNYGYTTMYRGETTIQECEWTIRHNEDGSSPEQYIETNWWASYGGTGMTGTRIVFPNIARYSTIQSATNFNDEGNPTITFTNFGLYDLRAKLLVGNTEIYSDNLQGDETSYTYNLSSSQRNQLRTLCTGKTLEVTLQLCSVENNSIVYTSPTSVTMSMINAEPTFTYTMTETNQKVINELGSSSASTIIQNASNVLVTITPTAYKNATISAVNVVYNGLTYTATTSPYTLTIPIVNSNVFTLNVIDSRGYVTSQVDSNRTLLSYEAVKTRTFSFKRYAPTSSNVILNAEFTYWSSFGSISNTPVVKWKLDDGNYTTIPSTNYSIDTTNHKLTITNYTLSNVLVYTLTGQFTIYIEDKLTSDFVTSDNGKVNRGIPTMDLGEHDLQVNGDLYVADTNRENKVNVLNAIASATSIEESGTGYIKFKDGTMICYGSKNGDSNLSDYWGTNKRTDEITIDFPKTFYSAPYINLTPNESGIISVVKRNNSPSTTQCKLYVIKMNGTSDRSYDVHYIAIGRWKS